MRILAFTNLFPNAAEPARGLFNLQSFQAVSRQCSGLQVVAPIRLLPRSRRCGNPDVTVPVQEVIEGLRVWHPRYFLLPKIGVATQAAQMRFCLARAMGSIRRQYSFDVLFATWAFPDVVAAAAMARRWGVPLAAKVHGADVNLFTRHPRRRSHIARALNQACVVVSVTQALKERLVEIGVPPAKIVVQPNGINSELFQVQAREVARRAVGMDPEGLHLVYVGTFRVTKGLDVLVEAVARLSRANLPLTLHLVGDGPQLEPALREQARAAGIGDRVRFEGYQEHARVSHWIAAADALCLPSTSDGCPNIVLEALACGRPVVASRVGGIPEILSEEHGVLVEPGHPEALAHGIRRALETPWEPRRLRASVLHRSWDANAAEFHAALQSALGARADEWKSGRVGEGESGRGAEWGRGGVEEDAGGCKCA